MIIIFGALLGAIIGGTTAYRRKGNGKDIAQYAAGYSIAFVIVSLLITVILDRTLI